jgi:hypothetical protein
VRVVLKRGVKLFAISAAFVAATLGFAYFVDSLGAGVVRRWIAGCSQPDQEEPLLYVHVYVPIGWGELSWIASAVFRCVPCNSLVLDVDKNSNDTHLNQPRHNARFEADATAAASARG